MVFDDMDEIIKTFNREIDKSIGEEKEKEHRKLIKDISESLDGTGVDIKKGMYVRLDNGLNICRVKRILGDGKTFEGLFNHGVIIGVGFWNVSKAGMDIRDVIEQGDIIKVDGHYYEVNKYLVSQHDDVTELGVMLETEDKFTSLIDVSIENVLTYQRYDDASIKVKEMKL